VAARATRRETEADYDEAFQLYISSAQSYLYLIRNVPDGVLKDRLKETSSKLLNRAEQIKSHRRHTKPVIRDRVSLGARSGSERVRENQWLRFPALVFSFKRCQQEPPLNAAQKQLFLRWVPVSEINPDISLYKPGKLDPTDIVQDVVTDCSLIASFAVSTNHANRFSSKLNVACLYPKDCDGNPKETSDGIYRVKLLLNGIYREVRSVDNKIPTGADRPMMCAQSRRGDIFWPALIEKAYMKAMAGYEFVGSFVVISLFALTGWIPETIFTTSEEYRGETSWQRILKGFEKGHCLVTVGTNGNISDALDSVGLIPFHDYAILGMSEDANGKRLLKLYNAWKAQSDESAVGWTSDLKNALPGIQISRQPELVGTFTISWDSLETYFDTIHLNWDPSRFECQQAIHFSDAPPPAFKVQFGAAPHSMAETEVWILLTRHFSAQRLNHEKYMSFSVFVDENDEDLISATDYVPQPIASTPLSNANHLLARFVPSCQQAAFSINFSFHNPKMPSNHSTCAAKPSGYTLNVYSRCSCVIRDAGPVSLPYTSRIVSKWTSRTAGGNHALATFMNNPMWRVVIGNATHQRAGASHHTFKATLTAIDAEGEVESGKPVNVKLVRAEGDGRVYDVERRDLVADSGSYTRGRAQLRTRGILPGNYTIVPSTFDAGVLGGFNLGLECELPIAATTPIPPEGAGMYKRTVSATWNDERRREKIGWHVSGGKGSVKIKFRAQATANPGIFPMKLTLLKPSSPQESRKIIVSGTFTDALSGAALGPLHISFTDDLGFVISVDALGDCLPSGSGYVLTMYADHPLTITHC
ncbi:hypothetical protein CROQUDRAFT_41464, partial [Cronartium quercuum f. sp. fusiforme G11]